MSKVSSRVSNETTPSATSSYREAAQQRIEELRSWRDQIPHFVIPENSNAARRLSRAASVPPEFVELAGVGLTNHQVLTQTAAIPPSDMNELMEYAQTFAPVADELEKLMKFIRYSTTAARHAAGSQALATYGVASRLARQPETAELAPLVTQMRRALGRGRKAKPATPPPDAPKTEAA